MSKMKKRDSEQFSQMIEHIDAEKFLVCLDQYLTASSEIDRIRKKASGNGAIQSDYEKCYAAIMQEAGSLLSQSEKALNNMINFCFRRNGHPEKYEKTYHYFRLLKKHQMELLSSVADEVRIIQDSIRQSEKFRRLIWQNNGILQKATYLMGVLGDRIANRPTTLLRLEGKSENIRELNHTFNDVNKYEDAYERDFRDNGRKPGGALTSVMLVQVSDLNQNADIEERKQKIIAYIKELHEGWEFLKGLVIKGYSRRMKKGLNRLAESHNKRRCEFQRYIMECRKEKGEI